MAITTLKGCHLKAVMFGDMAKGGFLQVYQCVEHPRLFKTIARETRDTKPCVTWSVDGVEVANLEAAIAKLNEPPPEIGVQNA